jgi:hypothetical protein
MNVCVITIAMVWLFSVRLKVWVLWDNVYDVYAILTSI